MAVTSVTLGFRGQSANDDGKKRTFTEVWNVETNDPLDCGQTVIEANGLPRMGEYFESGNDRDREAVVKSIAPKRSESSRLFWSVTVTYETPDDPKDENKQKPDSNGKLTEKPDDWRPEVSVSPVMVQVPVEKATLRTELSELSFNLGKVGNDGPIINSAGIPFDPPPTIEYARKMLRITKSSLKYPADHETKYENRVNKDPWVLILPGYIRNFSKQTVRFIPFEASLQRQQLQNGAFIDYWQVNYNLLIDEQRGWRMKILDRGIHTFVKPGDPDGKGGTWSSGDFPSGIPPLVRVTDPNGIPISEPVLFDLKGKPSNGKPYWIEYEVYEEVSFAALRF